MKTGIVVDLDGTLLLTNTFADYVRYAVRRSLARWRCLTAVRILLWAVMRKARCVSHSTMKWHILRLSEPFMRADRAFARREAAYLNPGLMERLDALAHAGAECAICLATAAPAVYVAPLRRMLPGVGYCCATPFATAWPRAQWRENVGAEKARRVGRILSRIGAGHDILFTDDLQADAPLADACAVVYKVEGLTCRRVK